MSAITDNKNGQVGVCIWFYRFTCSTLYNPETVACVLYAFPMETADDNLGKYLKRLRLDAGLSQPQLADALKKLDEGAACSRSRISEIENGKLPSKDLANLLDRYFETGTRFRAMLKDEKAKPYEYETPPPNNCDNKDRGFTVDVTLLTSTPAPEVMVGDKVEVDGWFRHYKPQSSYQTGESTTVHVFDFDVVVTERRFTGLEFATVGEFAVWKQQQKIPATMRYACITVDHHYWQEHQVRAAVRLVAASKQTQFRYNREIHTIGDSYEKRFIRQNEQVLGGRDFGDSTIGFGTATATTYARHIIDPSRGLLDNPLVCYATSLLAVKHIATHNRELDATDLHNLAWTVERPLMTGQRYQPLIDAIAEASETFRAVDSAIKQAIA